MVEVVKLQPASPTAPELAGQLAAPAVLVTPSMLPQQSPPRPGAALRSLGARLDRARTLAQTEWWGLLRFAGAPGRAAAESNIVEACHAVTLGPGARITLRLRDHRCDRRSLPGCAPGFGSLRGAIREACDRSCGTFHRGELPSPSRAGRSQRRRPHRELLVSAPRIPAEDVASITTHPPGGDATGFVALSLNMSPCPRTVTVERLLPSVPVV